MTESTTTDSAAPEATTAPAPKKSSGGLGGKVLAELQQIAAELGISGTSSMRKGALIDAIKEARGDAPAAPKADKPAKAPAKRAATKAQGAPVLDEAPAATSDVAAKADEPAKTDEPAAEKQEKPAGRGRGQNRQQGNQSADASTNQDNAKQDKQDNNKQDNNKSGKQSSGNQNNGGGNQNRQQGNRNQGNQQGGQDRNQDNNRGNQSNQDNRNADNGPDDDEGNGRRRNRRGRNRNNRGLEAEPTYAEDDVLVPAAGILDILDNYAFVRTTGYLPSENDVYVSLSMVTKWGLRRGDAVTGQVRQPREGERKEKFNPMVKVESVNGMSLEDSAKRVDYTKLTPLHPSERLRLEGPAGGLTGRVIDLVAPVAKGQRGLIVSPPKAGKTKVLQQISHAVTENNPEVHQMIVLVDERPEEVTDFQRLVKGEVIASTFDRPASDHTTVAELAIERAKRLVELGHDVVVLLDGVTRLGRAYHASASGRSNGDAAALHPAKQFFGAARNIEDGGSLTILATELVETGAPLDETIAQEFEGTGNWELRLRRDLADRRVFPAVDVVASSTRREEDLLAADELAAINALRRSLSGEGAQGLETVIEQIRTSGSNADFLRQVKQTRPAGS